MRMVPLGPVEQRRPYNKTAGLTKGAEAAVGPSG